MHKIFLTEQEVSIINGADAVVKEFGGFPSMENGRIHRLMMSGCGYGCCSVTIVFDVMGWADVSSRYTDIPKPAHKFLQLNFSQVRKVYMGDLKFDNPGEIKFGNTLDRSKMHQDIHPSCPVVVERPFCTFYMRSGSDFVIEFSEEECWIEASFADAE